MAIAHKFYHLYSSTSRKVRRARQREPSSSVPTTPESRERSSADSVKSYDTTASSVASALPPLQTKATLDEAERLEPLIEDDPQSFSLLSPPDSVGESYSLERRSVQLFSRDHLKAIFADPSSLLKFTSFLSTYRPDSISILIYYLDALKALRAINYANAVAEALEPIEGYEFTVHPPRATVNSVIEDKANQAFDALVRDDLPAFISHTYVRIVSLSIHKRITGTLAPHLREASEGLAEVFCLSDPSRPDNPIVFASEGMMVVLHPTDPLAYPFRIPQNYAIRRELCHRSELSILTRSKDRSVQHQKITRSCRSWERPL